MICEGDGNRDSGARRSGQENQCKHEKEKTEAQNHGDHYPNPVEGGVYRHGAREAGPLGGRLRCVRGRYDLDSSRAHQGRGGRLGRRLRLAADHEHESLSGDPNLVSGCKRVLRPDLHTVHPCAIRAEVVQDKLVPAARDRRMHARGMAIRDAYRTRWIAPDTGRRLGQGKVLPGLHTLQAGGK
jgi:hypothetical protein